MPSHSRAEWIAIALLLMIGVPGITVGASLAAAIGGTAPLLPAGLVGYGVAALAGAAGMILGRRWGWPVGVVTVVVGLLILAAILALTGARDSVIWGGVAIWSVALVALLVARNAARH